MVKGISGRCVKVEWEDGSIGTVDPEDIEIERGPDDEEYGDGDWNSDGSREEENDAGHAASDSEDRMVTGFQMRKVMLGTFPQSRRQIQMMVGWSKNNNICHIATMVVSVFYFRVCLSVKTFLGNHKYNSICFKSGLEWSDLRLGLCLVFFLGREIGDDEEFRIRMADKPASMRCTEEVQEARGIRLHGRSAQARGIQFRFCDCLSVFVYEDFVSPKACPH
ncbi:unnamed protein product [Arabidopsis halleri]